MLLCFGESVDVWLGTFDGYLLGPRDIRASCH